jgi:2-polyprenyl-3-methyl-5-hydroxy-6-metoxy-1,4-benzoquinol methylase
MPTPGNEDAMVWPEETATALKTRLLFVAKALQAINARDILDIGCGTGEHLTHYLARLYPESQICGIDEDPASISFAAQKFKDLRNLSFASSPPEGRTFDAVIASEILEHIDDPVEFLSCLIARLRSDGIMIITVPNGYGCSEAMSLLEACLTLSGIWIPLRRLRARQRNRRGAEEVSRDTLAFSPHVNFFSHRRIVSMFETCGLKVQGYKGRMFLHNFICSRIIDGSSRLADINAHLGAVLPPVLVSDWMFCLSRSEERIASLPPYRRNVYEKTRRAFNMAFHRKLSRHMPACEAVK